ncbi:hypothetical protein GCM10009804_58680 [Kribbella hippodromi]|uniref:Uncharacterized protein n=1 Tax=Kribbella hippodromi TaxID=434347 RepID=A0ABN2E2G3_9ACTN
MRTYRWIWGAVAGGLFLPSLAAAVLELSVAVWAILAFAAVPFGLMLVVATDGATSESPRARRLRVLKLTATGYLVTVATIVLIGLLGSGALVLVGLVLATSPPAIHWYLARFGRVRPQLAAVSTQELCQQWSDSYEQLARASTSNARLRVVMARQHCLDELERRDPNGLQAWLASSASAGSDPHRFLTDRE